MFYNSHFGELISEISFSHSYFFLSGLTNRAQVSLVFIKTPEGPAAQPVIFNLFAFISLEGNGRVFRDERI